MNYSPVMFITRTSPITGKANIMTLNISETQMDDWENGSLIQDAMPNLNSDQREFLMTGLTPQDWDYLFGDGLE